METEPCFAIGAPLRELRVKRTGAGATRRRPRRVVPAAATPPPAAPKVKSSYYKNPSKAIEKGGGFFIPGLQGPRLRVFVGVVTGALLGVNHAALSPDAGYTASLAVSEFIATAAAGAVLLTAAVDIAAESAPLAASIAAPSEAVDSGAEKLLVSPVDALQLEALADDLEWVSAVSADLVQVTSFVLFSGARQVFSRGVARATEPGAAVERVGQEGRALYVDDSSALPPEIDFPFLGAGVWSVFMVPAVLAGVDAAESHVAVFATEKRDGVTDPTFSAQDRTWLSQVVKRLET